MKTQEISIKFPLYFGKVIPKLFELLFGIDFVSSLMIIVSKADSKFCLFICHFRMDKTVMAWYNKGATKKARGFYYG